MSKYYKKKRPKVFYLAAVVPDESPGVPIPIPVLTALMKVSALERRFYH